MSIFVSYLLFAYNHERYIEAALRSALDQDYEPMEIIVTDDCSTDGTADIIDHMLGSYRGPKQVRFIRNSTNLGLASAINNAVAAANGKVVVGAAGDDESLPERTAIAAEAFERDSGLQLLFGNAEVVDEQGAMLGLYYKSAQAERNLGSFIAPATSFLGATMAWRRELFDVFGPLNERLMVEDRVIPLRAAISGRIEYVDRPIIRYRRHMGNHSNKGAHAVRDFASWQVFLKRVNASGAEIYDNRLRDIETGMRLYPDKRAQLEGIRRAQAKYRMWFACEHRLLHRPTMAAKLMLTARVLLTRGSRRFAKRWLRTFFTPRSYYRTVKRSGLPKPTLG